MLRYIGKSVLNDHFGSCALMRVISKTVITLRNYFIKRLRCTSQPSHKQYESSIFCVVSCLDTTSSSDEDGLPISDDDSAFSSSEESVIMLTYPDRHQPRSLSAQKEHAEVVL